MLRTLAGVLAGTLVGLSVARFIEGAGAALMGFSLEPGASFPLGFLLLLVFSWGAGAFCGCATALLIARRWAPVGGIAGASTMLLAVIVMASNGLAWWLWPLSTIVISGASMGAIHMLGAVQSRTPPQEESKVPF